MFILEGTLKGQSGHDGAWCKGGGGGDAEQGRDLRERGRKTSIQSDPEFLDLQNTRGMLGDLIRFQQ